MQTFDNDTNCAQLYQPTGYHVKSSRTFNQISTVSGICSKYPSLTCIRAHRCMCHSLMSARVINLLAWHSCHTQNPRHWFLEQATPQFITPNQTTSTFASGLHYLWHRTIAFLSVLCVQNVNELKQHLLDVRYGMKRSALLTMAHASLFVVTTLIICWTNIITLVCQDFILIFAQFATFKVV